MGEFINVPVPAEHVTEVYALLARLAGKSISQPAKTDVLGGEWTVEDLRALKDEPRISVKRMGMVLDVLARKPGVPMAFSEVAHALSLTREELQGVASGFSRWAKKQWPDDHLTWPVAAENGPAKDAAMTTEAFYTISAVTAEQWVRLRAE